MKKTAACALALMALVCLCSCARGAGGEEVTRERIFESSDPENEGPGFPEEIEHGGRKYIITGFISTEVLDERQVLEKCTDVEAEDEGSIPKNVTVDLYDRAVTMRMGEVTDVERDVPVRKTVTHLESFTEYFTSPALIPDTVRFTVKDRGEEKTVEGTLVETRMVSPYEWRDTRDIVGVWEGGRGATDAYVLDGTDLVIPYDSASPTWPGYEKDILASMKLPSSVYRVTGGRWASDRYTDREGRFIRQAIYPAQEYSAEYERTYSASFDTVVPLKGKGHLWLEEEQAEKTGIPFSDDEEQGIRIVKVYSIKASVRYVPRDTED